jgi:ssDNA-binding replication factor A large subunit
LLVADNSGVLRAVFWNHKTSLIESGDVKVGKIVRFLHGYTKEDRDGNVELHIGTKSEVETNPKNMDEKDFPSISKFITSIRNVNSMQGDKKVNVSGTVRRLFPASAFQRQDLSSGKVARFMLDDETGSIAVVVWNEKVTELEKNLKENASVNIIGARIKKSLGERLELHINGGTFVEVAEVKEKFLKIADLKEDQSNISIEAEVTKEPFVRKITTSKGETVELASLELKDETGITWLSAWRKHAGMVKDLKKGDRIRITGAYAKKGFGDKLEISTRDNTSLVIGV